MVLREGKSPSRRSERENRLAVAPRSFQASTGFGIGALRPLSTRPRPDPVHRPLPLRSRHSRRLFLHLQVPRRVVPAFACYGVACSVSSHIVHGWSLSAMSAVDCTASANANESPAPALGVRHSSGTDAGAVGQAGSLRGGCLPPPSRANAPVGRLPIGRSLPSCPTNSALCLACPYARLPATWPANRAGVHFYVAHPPASVGEGRAPISALHPASSACCAKREPFISGADQLLRK